MVMNNLLPAPEGLKGGGETQTFKLIPNRSFPSLISMMCCTKQEAAAKIDAQPEPSGEVLINLRSHLL